MPSEVGNLQQLEYLLVAHNQVEAIPWEVTSLAGLKTLNLFHNSIRTLPYHWSKLQSLTYLQLGFNQLKRLPAAIGELSQLETLSVFSNQLTQLPKEINQLKRLRELNVADNALEAVHLDLDSLREIHLYINPLKTLNGKTLEKFRSLPAQEKFYQYIYLDSNQGETVGESVAEIACLKVLDVQTWQAEYTKEIPLELQAKYGIKDSRYERLMRNRTKSPE